MQRYMYSVCLKLDEPLPRRCRRVIPDFEGVVSVSFGWYDVYVFADGKDDAIVKAKQLLADYKKVRVEEFFENTSWPDYWTAGTVAICPECRTVYKDWQMQTLEYYVCPSCRRRCLFEHRKNNERSVDIAKVFNNDKENKL